MARTGVSDAAIRQAIGALEAEGAAPTVTSVRERLGSGSYSTISAVLHAWKSEKEKRPTIPEVPHEVAALFRQLWEEAFRAADLRATAERKKHAEDSAAWNNQAQEMRAEISRLEGLASALQAEKETFNQVLAEKDKELEALRLASAKAESSAAVLQEELQSARQELRSAHDSLQSWIERASRAETKLDAQKLPPRKG